ncbi:MAG: ATP-dependent DNA helicase RecG, partial [Parasporobacterium sp.]|nr:ATP-dependent DNA helicase RecG [Parasporobacterium sp.]
MRLTELKGIGTKTEELFINAGIHDVMDLLLLFPRDYEEFNPPTAICEIGYRNFAVLKGVFTREISERRGGKVTVSQTVFRDEAGDSIRAFWFNAPFIKNSIKAGVPCIIRGRISRKFNTPQIDQPRVYSLAEYDRLQGDMQPVYSLPRGISNALMIKAIRQALETSEFLRLDQEDIIPGAVRQEAGLMRRSTAVKNMHFPENRDAFGRAAKRMAFEEIFVFLYLMKKSGLNRRKATAAVISSSEKTHEFLSSLPFALTKSQQNVIHDMEKDMASGFAMNRLVQGDVGCGKTMTAIAALMNAAYSGYQGALMAPTEVLAEQHYKTISGMFREYGADLNAALITGSMTALEKKVVYDALEDGRIDIIIGTHALIQEKIRFHNLGLVITDEQHRFGIKQREALVLKAGESVPHSVVMSATPIPRTLALILYGDMDVSIIDEVPSGRIPVKNAVVDDTYHDNAYRFIAKQVQAGRQAYIICPLVEYTEGMDAANAEDYTEMLREVMDPSIRIGKLTGPMPSAKKNEIMTRFAEGKIVKEHSVEPKSNA